MEVMEAATEEIYEMRTGAKATYGIKNVTTTGATTTTTMGSATSMEGATEETS